MKKFMVYMCMHNMDNSQNFSMYMKGYQALQTN
jgi:hypothetical protein